MPLSLDVLALEVPQAQAACDFYASSLSSTVIDRDRHTDLDLHGTGRISLTEAVSPAPARSGFPGYVLSYVVDQPSEVESLLDAAVRHGADILVPAEKGIFGGFSAVHRAPDGTVWKLSAPTRKDTGPARRSPRMRASARGAQDSAPRCRSAGQVPGTRSTPSWPPRPPPAVTSSSRPERPRTATAAASPIRTACRGR